MLLTRLYRSFAYYTVRERLPVILSSVLDQLTKDKELIVKEYGGNQVSLKYSNIYEV